MMQETIERDDAILTRVLYLYLSKLDTDSAYAKALYDAWFLKFASDESEDHIPSLGDIYRLKDTGYDPVIGSEETCEGLWELTEIDHKFTCPYTFVSIISSEERHFDLEDMVFYNIR